QLRHALFPGLVLIFLRYTKMGLVGWILLFLLILGCNQTKNNWIKAKQSNSIAEVKSFLKENPESEFSIEAKKLLDSLEWSKVTLSDSIDIVNEFIKNYPESKHLQEANNKVVKIDWIKAMNIHSVEFYKEFIKNHPNSEYDSIAKSILNSLGHQIEFKRVNLRRDDFAVWNGGSMNNYHLVAFSSGRFDYVLITDKNTVFKNIAVSNGSPSYSIDNNSFYLIRGRAAKQGEFNLEIRMGQQIIVASFVELIK
ncbi:MAG: hypothetical protein NT004_10965, partial [Bacteroidetes bacterium]|nr:hypothetical protein [Bacteroidota bacterium]